MSKQLGCTSVLLLSSLLFLGACQKKGTTMVPVVAPVPISQRPAVAPAPTTPETPADPLAGPTTPAPTAPVTPTEPGNVGGTPTPPPVVVAPATEPTRYWWNKVVWGADAKAFLEGRGFDATRNCGQIVNNNDTLMLEISDVACPEDNSLVAWSSVKVTLFYQPGDEEGRRFLYHSDYPSTYLGYFTILEGETNTVQVEQLCSGDYFTEGGAGTAGCHLDFSSGTIAGIGVDPGTGALMSSTQEMGARARSRALSLGY